MNRLTKSTYFIPIRTDFLLAKLTKLYIRKVVKLYEEPSSIISNRDLWLTSQFWVILQRTLGTRLDLSIAHHPQTEG